VMSLGKRLHIFLRNTFVVDEAGRTLLRRLSASGACLHAIGIYTSYLLQTLNTVGTKAARSPDHPPEKRN
jgi:hypothetical protein